MGAQARTGQQILSEDFPGGSGWPVYVLVPATELPYAAPITVDAPGVDSVSATVSDSDAGTAPINEKGEVQARGSQPAQDPLVKNGCVLLQATLSDAADSDEARDTVQNLRTTLDVLPQKV